ncbi:ComF family protein [Paenibacillus hamazuiensis]|uniref:ComF family protein n=1 Tax=Paenibacillus hamazuiensis TaxID=2936508 RepID=UPI00200FC1EC|nr:ComF family protein [Paenibacillus hamazuiensis]
MQTDWKKWTSRVFGQAVGRAESWMAPKAYDCLYCRRSYKGKHPLHLCPACAEAIPWIRSVQCGICGRYETCHDCQRRTQTYFVHNRSAVEYNPMMKELLAQYKYRGSERLRHLMGTILLHAFHLHREAAPAEEAVSVITYVPLSVQRLEERGFNQARQLAEDLGMMTGVPVWPFLRRTRHTDKQSFKTRGQRLGDLEGAFILDENFIPAARRLLGRHRLHIMIVDDVYTTGSTLNQCAKTIKEELDCDVFGISWSR